MVVINLIKAVHVDLVLLGYFFQQTVSVSVIFGLCAVSWCEHGVSVFVCGTTNKLTNDVHLLSHPVLRAGAGRVCCCWLCLCLLPALLLLVLVGGHMLGMGQGAKRLKP